MGNICDGSELVDHGQCHITYDNPRKYLEKFEARLRQKESLLLSRITELNLERSKLQDQLNNKRKGDEQNRIEQVGSPDLEDDRDTDEPADMNYQIGNSGPKRTHRARKSKKNQNSGKVCDFQFIVNYHLS